MVWSTFWRARNFKTNLRKLSCGFKMHGSALFSLFQLRELILHTFYMNKQFGSGFGHQTYFADFEHFKSQTKFHLFCFIWSLGIGVYGMLISYMGIMVYSLQPTGNQNNSLMFSWQRKLTIGAFTLLTSRFLNSHFFCLTIYTCPKNPELSASTKLRDFLDRYCACPTISYFSFDRECLQLRACVCVCVCVFVLVMCVCVSCMCMLASVCVRACVCV